MATVAAAPVVSREKKVERGDGQLSHTRFAGLTSKKPDVSKVKSRVDTRNAAAVAMTRGERTVGPAPSQKLDVSAVKARVYSRESVV